MTAGTAADGVDIRERRQEKPSPWEQLVSTSGRAIAVSLRVGLLTMFMVPVFFASLVTLDLSFTAFDVFPAHEGYLNPSSWMTLGQFFMIFSFLVIALASRRFGEHYALAMVIMTWTLAALLSLAGVSYLAPQLEDGDLPAARFIAAFVAAWMIAHFVCLSIYELTRGVVWWRAPFYGAVWGSGAFTLLYFPLLYFNTGAPWINWMIADFGIKVAMAALFLLPYRWLRRIVKPMPGYGVGG